MLLYHVISALWWSKVVEIDESKVKCVAYDDEGVTESYNLAKTKNGIIATLPKSISRRPRKIEYVEDVHGFRPIRMTTKTIFPFIHRNNKIKGDTINYPYVLNDKNSTIYYCDTPPMIEKSTTLKPSSPTCRTNEEPLKMYECDANAPCFPPVRGSHYISMVTLIESIRRDKKDAYDSYARTFVHIPDDRKGLVVHFIAKNETVTKEYELQDDGFLEVKTNLHCDALKPVAMRMVVKQQLK